MFCQYALWVELHAVDRQLAVAHAHDLAGLVPGAALERRRQRRIDDQRVVARRRERLGQAGEETPSVVADAIGLTMHHGVGTLHRGAEGDSDALVAQAHAQHRHAALGEEADRLNRHPRLGRCTGAGRDQQVGRPCSLDLRDADLVVARDCNLGAQCPQQLHQVVGKRIVVVDDEHVSHGSQPPDGPANSSWASSTARSRAAALLWVSAYSRAGSESATMPAPACA